MAARLKATLAALALLIGLAMSSQAQVVNLLVNSGAETGDFTGWTIWNPWTYGPPPAIADFNIFAAGGAGAPPNSGNYDFQVYGNFYGASEYDGMFQSFPAHVGQTFNADGWVYQLPTDSFTSANSQSMAYFEVEFKDGGGNVLGKYDSLFITNGSPTGVWYDLQATNQYDPTSGAYLGTVSQLVAPASTVSVEFDFVFDTVNYGGGSVYLDDMELLGQAVTEPPCYLTNIVPAGVILATNQNLTFSVMGPGGPVTNVQVSVTSISGLANATTNTVSYTNSSPGSIAGLNTTEVDYSLPLAPNNIYTVVIQATDTNLNSAAKTVTFDTIQPVYLFEAEDFNYGGGQWVTSITADGGLWAYANQIGTDPIDEHDGNPGNGVHHYRPSDPVSVQGAAEISPSGSPINRQKYLNDYAINPADAANPDTQDEEVGYVNTGDWQDYTRNFPAGKYNVYARLAVSGNSAVYFGTVGGDPTTASQTFTNLGTFSITDNNWNIYQYCPLLDQYGNLVSVTLGGTQTVRVQVGPGSGPNENFFMIVPAVAIPKPVLQSSYPDGIHPFEPTNHFTFTVGQGAGPAIAAGNVGLKLNGADVTAQVAFTSTDTNWTGTISILSNMVYTAVINVTNSTHQSSTYTIGFDTFSQANFIFEAEDFDFNGGSFIDNPTPTADSTINGSGTANGTLEADSYYGYPGGTVGNASVAEVDFHSTETGQSEQYRIDPPGTQVCGDWLRQKFDDAQTALSDPNVADFNLGWFSTGTWLNYTRHYPAGKYNVYGRMAGGAGAFSGTTLSLVTSGWGTTTQATNLLGSFADPTASGWQNWHWVPMLDANSNLVTVTFDGTQQTLKLDSGNNLNVNFLMLVPAVTPAQAVSLTISQTGPQVGISFATQSGHTYKVLWTSSLASPVVWSTLTAITGDGSIHTVNDTASGAARYYRVSAQ